MSRPSHRAVTESERSPAYETNWPALYGAVGFCVILVATTVVSHRLPDIQRGAVRTASGSLTVADAVLEPRGAAVARHAEAVVAKTPNAFGDPQPAVAPTPPDVVVTRIPQMVAGEFVPAVAKHPREDAFHAAGFVPSETEGRWTSASRFDWPRGEYELSTELQQYTPVLALDSVEGSSDHLLGKSMSDEFPRPSSQQSTSEETASPPGAARLEGLLAQRPDLRGLPFRMGNECVANSEEVGKKRNASRTIGRLKAMRSRQRSGTSSTVDMERFARDLSRYQEQFLDGGYVSVLVQMLQAEAIPIRQRLVEQLVALDKAQSWTRHVQNVAQYETKVALELSTDLADSRVSVALARLSVFDLSPEVREAALAVLKDRQADTFRRELLAALRYPWPPIADHAAAALVELKDVEAVPQLADMLDEPDPRAPFRSEEKEWVVRELVCVNHLRNCLLCHPPANSSRDQLVGLIPTPGKPIPVAYYHSSQGDFVRADVTFLRQDFSVNLPVENHAPWPREQRFDFMVRTRPATADELVDRSTAPTPESNQYPQRQAVLYALRELTGEDFGEEAEPWRRSAATYQPIEATEVVVADE